MCFSVWEVSYEVGKRVGPYPGAWPSRDGAVGLNEPLLLLKHSTRKMKC